MVQKEMEREHIEALLNLLDGTGSDAEWAAVLELRTLGSKLPQLLGEHFHRSRSWKVRSSCVYHAMRYAKESDTAVVIGLAAIKDKAQAVRYRGAMLLAYSQRKDVLAKLHEARAALQGKQGADDMMAAIDAIESENHNYFVDRTHSNNVTMTID